MPFNKQHEKFLNLLENPGFNVGQLLIRTAGKGRANGKSYTPPTKKVVANTQSLYDCLYAFDANPDEATFTNVQNALKALNMKAVRVADAPEWIYVTPNANPGTPLWNRYSMQSQFDLSWHVGNDSKVAISDEHNGGDGCFRVISELVKQGSNIKLVMSNSRNRRTSKRVNGRYVGDWAHSKKTIDYPVMSELARNGYSVINVHGMASKTYGLLVNNYSSNFVKGQASLPTLIGISLAKYFNDSDNKKFVFGGVLPGKILIDDKLKPLSPPNNAKNAPNAIFRRATGVHNTNVIGNAINNISNRINNRKPGDSGKSCHIEFGIVRDGRKDLVKVIAAINLAVYWMNNYKPELNAWEIVKNDPEFDMLKYGDLFEMTPEYAAVLREMETNINGTSSVAVEQPMSLKFDIDLNPDDPEFKMSSLAEDENDDDVVDLISDKLVAPILISGGPAKTNKPAKESTNTQAKQKPAPGK